MAAFKFKGYDVNLEIEGLDKLVDLFKSLPEKLSDKILTRVLRKGAAAINVEIKKQIPPTIKGIGAALDVAIYKQEKESPKLLAGFFKKKRYFSNKTGAKRKADLKLKGDSKFDAFTIAYWHNYGTYANRTSVYRFRTPRKTRTARRPGGIPAGMFFQKGAVAGIRAANEIITKDIDGIIEKELNKLR